MNAPNANSGTNASAANEVTAARPTAADQTDLSNAQTSPPADTAIPSDAELRALARAADADAEPQPAPPTQPSATAPAVPAPDVLEELSTLRAENAALPTLRTQLANLGREVERLNGLLQVDGGSRPTPTRPRAFDDLSTDEQATELRRMAMEADEQRADLLFR